MEYFCCPICLAECWRPMANGSEELVMVLMPKMGLEQPLAPMGTNSLANGNDGAVRYANWVSAADTYPASTADICPVSTEDIHPVPTADICPLSQQQTPLSSPSRHLSCLNNGHPRSVSTEDIYWHAPCISQSGILASRP